MKSGKFRAYLCAQGRRIYCGIYETAEAAARAYDAKAREHHGEYAVLNFPND